MWLLICLVTGIFWPALTLDNLRRQILIRDHSGIRLSEIDISSSSVMMCQLSEWKRWTPWARENPSWKCVPMERANFDILISSFWLTHLSFSFTKTVNVVLWAFLDFLDFCGPLDFLVIFSYFRVILYVCSLLYQLEKF